MRMKITIAGLTLTLFGCNISSKHSGNLKKEAPQKTITSMITGTTGAEALDGGLEILKKGGNAMDAALSTSLSQIALAGGSWVSYAGLMNLVYYEVKTGKVYNMNASFNTIKNENDPLSITGGVNFDFTKKGESTNGRSVLVPGYMAGLEAAHKRFGNLSFAEIFNQAISIAEKGFPWNNTLQYYFNYRKEILTRLPETKAVFARTDGTPYKAGDIFTQPALAKTLRNIVKEGSKYMYTGEWGKKLVKTVQAEGGKMTMNDLQDYKVTWTEPIKSSYNGFDLYVHGLPAYGGLNIIEGLNLLEVAELGKQEPYYKNPQILKELSDIIRVGEMAAYMADGLKSIPNLDFTLEGRTKKENAIILYQLLKQGYFSGTTPASDNTPKHSDAIVVVDKWGNICAMTHTINSIIWGGTGIFIDGISIGDPASFQQKQVAKAGPGNRLPDPTNPGIVLKNGKPILGFASIGAGLHAKTISSLLAVLDYKLTPQEAIDLPGLGGLIFNPNGSVTRSVDTSEFKNEIIKRTNKLGGGFVNDISRRGYWVGILIDSAGNLHGSIEKKLIPGGKVLGY
jgi:gamma-glutamyltranspeptidase / glutathione hydrolase